MAANLPREARLEKIRRAWKLACEGRTQSTIAADLGISQSQVCRYLAASRRRIMAGLGEEELTYAVLSLRQSDKVIEESFLAFERSTRPKKRATKKTAAGAGKGDSLEGQTTTEVVEREGDPAWLATAMAAIRLRRELLDRLAPPKANDETQGADSVAGALLEAENRDAAYQSEDRDAAHQ